jgi:hypothetical protein
MQSSIYLGLAGHPAIAAIQIGEILLPDSLNKEIAVLVHPVDAGVAPHLALDPGMVINDILNIYFLRDCGRSVRFFRMDLIQIGAALTFEEWKFALCPSPLQKIFRLGRNEVISCQIVQVDEQLHAALWEKFLTASLQQARLFHLISGSQLDCHNSDSTAPNRGI